MESAVNILKERADLEGNLHRDRRPSSGCNQRGHQKLIEDNKGDIDVYVLRVGEDTVPGNMAITKLDVSSADAGEASAAH